MNHTEPKEENELDAAFWDERWKNRQTGWDIGYPSPPLIEYVRQYSNKDAAVLIPGCGNAHEAAALVEAGFQNITLLDISPEAVSIISERFKEYPQIKVICTDFFQHEGKYDLILEQTFFCAQVISRREEYVKKVHELLKDGGILAGVLFSCDFGPTGPPFGGSTPEYTALFEPLFEIKTMEPCYNSIPPRAGNELFIILKKK